MDSNTLIFRFDSVILHWSLMSIISEKNNLSFIETSALDSTNVETAFQNILTGKSQVRNDVLSNPLQIGDLLLS